MYFWRIESLKEDLRAGPLTSDRAFPYVLALGLAYTTGLGLLAALGSEVLVAADWIGLAFSLVIIGVGTYAAYWANGGPAGIDFAARSLALGWVVGIRVTALLVPLFLLAAFVLVVVAVVLSGGGEDESDRLAEAATPWLGAAFTVAAEAYYFLRLAGHFRDVAVPGTEAPTDRGLVP